MEQAVVMDLDNEDIIGILAHLGSSDDPITIFHAICSECGAVKDNEETTPYHHLMELPEGEGETVEIVFESCLVNTPPIRGTYYDMIQDRLGYEPQNEDS